MTDWKTNIFATHEEQQPLARNRPWPGEWFPGVALPCKEALERWVMIRFGSLYTCAIVWDVGPWCTDDSAYVLGIARPRAEQLKGQRCPRTLADPDSVATVPDGKGGNKTVFLSNSAGIDLFPFTARRLGIGIGENVNVDWRFVDL